MSKNKIIKDGLSKGAQGIITICYTFGDQESHYFKQDTIEELIQGKYITHINGIISLTQEGKSLAPLFLAERIDKSKKD